jgi:DNA-binding MarR family transcriptional regulator
VGVLTQGLVETLTDVNPLARREAARVAPYYADERICELLAGLAERETSVDVAAAARMANEVRELKRFPDVCSE